MSIFSSTTSLLLKQTDRDSYFAIDGNWWGWNLHDPVLASLLMGRNFGKAH